MEEETADDFETIVKFLSSMPTPFGKIIFGITSWKTPTSGAFVPTSGLADILFAHRLVFGNTAKIRELGKRVKACTRKRIIAPKTNPVSTKHNKQCQTINNNYITPTANLPIRLTVGVSPVTYPPWATALLSQTKEAKFQFYNTKLERLRCWECKKLALRRTISSCRLHAYCAQCIRNAPIGAIYNYESGKLNRSKLAVIFFKKQFTEKGMYHSAKAV